MLHALNALISTRALVVLSIVGAAMIAYGEEEIAAFLFVFEVFLTLWMLIYFASRRIRFSLVTTWVVIGIITAISTMKIRDMRIALHLYDVYFYYRNDTVFAFLFESYRVLLVIAFVALCAGIAVCILAYRQDRPIGGSRKRVAFIFAMSLAAAILSRPANSSDSSYYVGGHRTSSFFISLKDAPSLFLKSELTRRLETEIAQAGYGGSVNCGDGPKPDLVTVLMESTVPPSLYPAIKSNAAFDEMFRSEDGPTRNLRVETFAAGTWITTAGLMTSLPMLEFGWLRPYVPLYLYGRVHHSLPRVLRQCGYRTAVVSPLDYPFLNEGPFMTALGVEDYLDKTSIGAASTHQPDTLYFRAALDYIAKQRKEDGRPLFVFVMTMGAHGPYEKRFEPDVKVPGEPFGNGAEMDEYLRRLHMQQAAFIDFKKELAAQDESRPTVVLDFGDHQPYVTYQIAEKENPGALADWNSRAYLTYFRFTALNTKLAPLLNSQAPMDLVYLAPTLLQVAGLPIDDVYSGLLQLRDDCDGAFRSCTQHKGVDHHLRKLVKGNLLELEGAGGKRKAMADDVKAAEGQLAGEEHSATPIDD